MGQRCEGQVLWRGKEGEGVAAGGGHSHGAMCVLSSVSVQRRKKRPGLAWLVELGLAQLGWLTFFNYIISLFCFSLQNKPFAIILFEQK